MLVPSSNRIAFALAPLLALLLTSAGCGAVFEKDMREVIVTSSPAGAQVRVNGRPYGVTPTRVQVNNHRSVQITLEKAGHYAAGCIINADIQPIWLIGDLLLFYTIVPLVIDLATGQWNALESGFCSVHLPPMPAGGSPRNMPAPPLGGPPGM